MSDTKVRYYTGKEKEFIELLELVGEKGWAKVQSVMETLKKISPAHLSTEKIVSICRRNNDPFPVITEGDTATLSKDILKAYGRLLNKDNHKFEGALVL